MTTPPKFVRVIPNRKMPNPAPHAPTAKPRDAAADDAAATQWLTDAPARSAHALTMINGGSGPGPTPTPPSDFQTALQAACDEQRVLRLNGPITLDAPVAVKINHSASTWFGLDGGLNRITSNVVGAPAIRFYMDESVPVGTCARAMMVRDFSMFGAGRGTGLQLDIPFNDRWLVNLEMRSLWFEGIGGKAACTVAGSIFESFAYNIGTQNSEGAGLYFANAGPDGNRGVVSAFRIFGGTQRQNKGAGYLVDQYDGPGDVRMYGLYFCENGKEGISSLAGLELVDGCGFENNHGGSGIYVSNYATLQKCTGSTHGPQQYLITGYLANPMSLRSCSVVGYGGGAPRLGKFSGNGKVLLSDSGDGANVDAEAGVTVEVVATE
jgi:hypothetical protein